MGNPPNENMQGPGAGLLDLTPVLDAALLVLGEDPEADGYSVEMMERVQVVLRTTDAQIGDVLQARRAAET